MVSRACFGALTHLTTARKQNILLAGSAFFPLSVSSRLQTSWMMLFIFRVGFYLSQPFSITLQDASQTCPLLIC